MNGVNIVRNPNTLGQSLTDLEAAAGLNLPTFSMDSNLLALGGGLLFLVFLTRRTSSAVRSYGKRRKKRKEIKSQIRELRKRL